MKTILLTVLVLVQFVHKSHSQISHQDRIEFELKDGYEDEEIIEFGKKGFVLFSRISKSEDMEYEWRYEKFSTSLKSIKSATVTLSKKMVAVETYTNAEMSHTLFLDRKLNFSIISVDAEDLTITKSTGILPKKTNIKSLSILGDFAVINGSIKKTPFLFIINWKTNERNLIPININDFRPKKTKVINVQVLTKSSEIILYVMAEIDRKNSDFFVIILNDKGEKKESFNLTKNITENIISASASKINEHKYIFTGTYSTNFSSSSEGIFICQTKMGDIDFIKFHNFWNWKISSITCLKRNNLGLKKRNTRKRVKEKN